MHKQEKLVQCVEGLLHCRHFMAFPRHFFPVPIPTEQLSFWPDPSLALSQPVFGAQAPIKVIEEGSYRLVKIRFGTMGRDGMLTVTEAPDGTHHLIFFERACPTTGRPRRLEILLAPFFMPRRRIGAGQHWESQLDHGLTENEFNDWHAVISRAFGTGLNPTEHRVMTRVQELLDRDSLFSALL